MNTTNVTCFILGIVSIFMRWFVIFKLYNVIRLDFMPILTFWQLFGLVAFYVVVKGINPVSTIKSEYKKDWTDIAASQFMTYLILAIALLFF